MINIFKKGLEKTLAAMSGPRQRKSITREELEEMLIAADITYEIVEEIIYYLPPGETVQRADLERVMGTYFMYEAAGGAGAAGADCATGTDGAAKPFVEMVLGVNGVGKTTSIGKLSAHYLRGGSSVLLAAADTFRAGAIEQLRLWAERNGCDVVATQQGHDPSAVAFDAIAKAQAKGYDRVIIDTAGRLENKKNLAAELEKIIRVSDRCMAGAPHRKILVLDATQGNAGINQAKVFNELVKLDGVIISKLDGTSKGGSLFAIARELELPILYFGYGEGAGDLAPFDAREYVKTLCDGIFAADGDGGGDAGSSARSDGGAQNGAHNG